MSTQDNSLNAYADRLSNAPSPASSENPAASPRGNYQDSVIECALWDFSNITQPQVASIDSGVVFLAKVVLFMSDAPAALTMTEYDGAGTSPLAPAAVSSSAGAPTALQFVPVTGLNITPTTSLGAAGTVGVYTINGVQNVPGYGVSLSLKAGSAATTIIVQAHANSGSTCGWAAFLGVDSTGQSSSVQSVIIDAASYTEAIRDAGNVITLSPGPSTDSDTYRVVGVWSQQV